jgi:AraC family transcriptional regulator
LNVYAGLEQKRETLSPAMRISSMATSVGRVTPALMQTWPLTVLHHLEVAGVEIWEIDLPPRFAAPPHEHEQPFFCTLLAGDLENVYADRPVEYRRFLTVYHPAATLHHSTSTTKGSRILTLVTSETWSRRLADYPALPTSPTPIPAEDGAWLARRLLAELHHPQPCSELVIEGLTLEMLAAALRSPLDESGGAPAWLARVLERLHDDLAEPLTLKRLATDAGIHPARLSAIFRRHTGHTVGDYRRDLQVQFVRQRLREPRNADEPVAEIALAAGFADQAHCTRVFKAATGWTPARYRASLLRGAEPLSPRPVPTARAQPQPWRQPRGQRADRDPF